MQALLPHSENVPFESQLGSSSVLVCYVLAYMGFLQVFQTLLMVKTMQSTLTGDSKLAIGVNVYIYRLVNCPGCTLAFHLGQALADPVLDSIEVGIDNGWMVILK